MRTETDYVMYSLGYFTNMYLEVEVTPLLTVAMQKYYVFI